MGRWATLFVLVLLGGLLAGCVESTDDDSDDTGDDSVAAEESPTPEPTEEVMEEPTEEPTEAPTEEPESSPMETEEPEAEETAEPEAEETTAPESEATAAEDEGDGADDGDGAEHTISIQDNLFEPAELEISVGDTVTWVNEGGLVHTSTLDPEIARDAANAVLPDGAETWDSGDMESGDEFSLTLDVPGEYVYFCRPHEALGMVGTIVVSDD